jgi:enoyl-CoA hydratase/carnithine racemase
MSTESVRVSDHGHVRLLTLDRPEKKNAFDNALYHELARRIRGALAERSVRVLVVTGSGDSFSAGQDMSEMSVEAGAGGGFPALLAALEECDKPIVAAVNGVGVGIGFTMLLHTDVNYIAEGARLRGPFTTLGVVPEAAASFLLPDLIGYPRAAEILLTARWIPAEEAVDLGLALAVVPRERLLEVALAKAAEIAARPPAAVRHTKRLMKVWRSQGVRDARRREDEAFQERLGTPENVEAITAFFEKRPPDFDRLPE